MESKEDAIVPTLEDDSIRSRIFTIRNVHVMLDRDLAELYGVEVKYLNRQVKRNIERFPDDFMFQLNSDECPRCQIGTLDRGRGSNIKYLPYAFTENGVAMLSGILRALPQRARRPCEGGGEMRNGGRAAARPSRACG